MKTKLPALIATAWAGLLSPGDQGAAQTWVPTSAPVTNWTSVACSADGSKMLAAVGGGSLYTSTNFGGTWTPASAPVAAWQGVATSADGKKMVAVSNPGFIYTSSDSGNSWTPSPAPKDYWSSVGSSGDGTRLVVGTYGTGGPPAISGRLFTSTNSGASWQIVSNQPGPFNGVAASADGSTFAALGFFPGPGVFGASDCLSSNWGEQIAHIYPQAIEPWTAVACSASGVRIVAGAYSDAICASMDAGVTWSRLLRLLCSSIAVSADGQKIAVVEGPTLAAPGLTGAVYTSTDSGNTWVSNSAPVTNWSCIASSADGCRLVATVEGGGIYMLQSTPAPVLNFSAPGPNMLLSWIVPSQPFVLQASADLNSAKWTDVTNVPVLNLTNLQSQLALPLPGSNSFYRLKSSVNGS